MQYLSILLIIFLSGVFGHFEDAKIKTELKKEITSQAVEQNVKIAKLSFNSAEQQKLGSLAFPPSTVEGTSTAGWTDDGSNVRLNTSSDFVGIGTSNPSEKLSVTGNTHVTGTGFFGGNTTIQGDATIGGGDINLGTGTATSTITSSGGKLGVATTSPTKTFSVHGDTFINGTTTTASLEVASSTVKLNGVYYRLPAADGTANQILSTDGSNDLSWASQNPDWAQLGEQVLGSPNATATVTIAARKDLKIILSVTGISVNDYPSLQFNSDYAGGGVNYEAHCFENYVSCTRLVSQPEMELGSNSTTSPSYWVIDIDAAANRTKKVFWTGIYASSTLFVTGSGNWFNQTASTTVITLVPNGRPTATWNTGTRLTVYGSKD